MYRKIISLVPSLTELLVDFGLKDQLAGRTRFCVHPKGQVKDIPIVGGTKNPRIDKIRSIQPDLIVANKEENRKEDIEELAHDFEVEVTDISSVEEAIAAIQRLGTRLGAREKALDIVAKARQRLDQRPDAPPLKIIYFIWKDPWMTVGGDTYISDVMQHWNLKNVFKEVTRYPVVQLNDIKEYNPDLILLSSEPYPFKEKHIPLVEEACPDARVLLVEGEWFSWYGSHMVHSFGRLNGWRRAIG